MKNVNKILFAFFSIVLAACGSYSNPAAPATTDTVTASIAGNWVITSLTERNEDKSGGLIGYVLSFATTSAESGTVTARGDNSTVSGSWSHSPAVTYYGSTSTESIVLNFSAGTPLSQVSGTWNVVSSTSKSLNLASPEVAQQERLVLNKQ
jgi:hypothetical protein